MMTQRLTERIQHKLLIKLMEFNYTIEYKKSKENTIDDALSRKDHDISTISSVVPLWVSNIENSYKDDQHLTNIIQQLAMNDQAVPHYNLHTGIVRYRCRICIGDSKELKTNILSSMHSSAIGGHWGVRATYHRVKKIFYWPHLKKEVEAFIAEHPIYQRAKGEHCKNPGLLFTTTYTSNSMDFHFYGLYRGLPKSGNKNCILVVVDRLTKYSHFQPLLHPFIAQMVAQLFMDQVFKLHGTPVAIVIDRDIIFRSKIW
jgi:hypothetical protein